MISDKCEHGKDDDHCGHWRSDLEDDIGGSLRCALCGQRFVPESELQALRVELLTVEGQCIEEHHWKGKCPALDADSVRAVLEEARGYLEKYLVCLDNLGPYDMSSVMRPVRDLLARIDALLGAK